MKKSKSWIGYAIYLLVIIGYLYGSQLLIVYLHKQASKMFNIFPYIMWTAVISVLFGALLGVVCFYRQMKKPGKWRVNLSQLVVLGVPSAVLVIWRLLAYSFNMGIADFIARIMFFNDYTPGLVGVLLGFTVLTSFHKSAPQAE